MIPAWVSNYLGKRGPRRVTRIDPTLGNFDLMNTPELERRLGLDREESDAPPI